MIYSSWRNIAVSLSGQDITSHEVEHPHSVMMGVTIELCLSAHINRQMSGKYSAWKNERY